MRDEECKEIERERQTQTDTDRDRQRRNESTIIWNTKQKGESPFLFVGGKAATRDIGTKETDSSNSSKNSSNRGRGDVLLRASLQSISGCIGAPLRQRCSNAVLLLCNTQLQAVCCRPAAAAAAPAATSPLRERICLSR